MQDPNYMYKFEYACMNKKGKWEREDRNGGDWEID